MDVELLKKAVAPVAQANGARLALLFGSHARGTATRHSDVDLLFVEETTDPYLRRLQRYLDPLADRLGTSVEVFVYTPAEFERMKAGSFVGRAIREGIILYESGEVQGRFAPVASAGEG
ncbi:MAG: nucleotidyltransferase domain-containing protein [Planctomycetota bacterium]|nr:nucleotidyltransferase domain-containing protein [Planctomycetota bacterium]